VSTKVKKLYKSALKNEKFLSAIFEADGDEKPGLFSRKAEKLVFASVYYGWLVSEYGSEWEKML
jgi:hypothetical protein